VSSAVILSRPFDSPSLRSASLRAGFDDDVLKLVHLLILRSFAAIRMTGFAGMISIVTRH
jgi:hypothetical protein